MASDRAGRSKWINGFLIRSTVLCWARRELASRILRLNKGEKGSTVQIAETNRAERSNGALQVRMPCFDNWPYITRVQPLSGKTLL